MDAAIYLAEHASRKVAHAYLDEFDRVASLIEAMPALGTPHDDGCRLYPLAKFRHSIIYVEKESGPLILAVASQSREPGYWKGRQAPAEPL